MTRVLSGIEPDPPLILCAMCSYPQALKVLQLAPLRYPRLLSTKFLQNIYQPKSCNVGLTPQPTSEGRSKIYYTNSEDDRLNKESILKSYDSKMTEFLNRGSLTGIQRDKYFQRIVDPRGKNFQKNKRSKSARYCMVVIVFVKFRIFKILENSFKTEFNPLTAIPKILFTNLCLPFVKAQYFITLFVISYWAYTDNDSALQLQVQLLFIHVNNIMIEIRYVTKELSLDRLEVTMYLLQNFLIRDHYKNVIDWLYRYFGERSRETENFITSRMKTAQESKKSITATYIIRGS
ncbi:hypothetical protein H8356DRAFT_1340827 [Neocallimastix lanati (nom. inval.)]|nr:hypothetical protein H8356DRAFT_1340827 [Neocallimastix sp. JGI-2020a]